MHCWWCHNPESQQTKQEILFREERCIGCGDCREACPTGAIDTGEGCILCGECVQACCSGARETVGRKVGTDEIIKEIEKDIVFYDQSGGGVTFSGGEPLGQKEFLAEILKGCREREIHTAVDTTGFCETEVILRISNLVDLFLYDLKLMSDEKHKKYTGVSNGIILENLRELAKIHAGIIIRLPLIPGVNDDAENIRKTGEFLAALNIKGVNILPYHHTGTDKYGRLKKEYKLHGTQAPRPEKTEEVKSKLTEFGLPVQIGG